MAQGRQARVTFPVHCGTGDLAPLAIFRLFCGDRGQVGPVAVRGNALKSSLLAAALLILSGSISAGREMQPPRLSSAQVEWAEAVAALADIDILRVAALGSSRRTARASRTLPPVVGRLNAIMSSRFSGVAISPVPVLLPFDTGALMRDQAAGTASLDNHRYLFGFQSADFFYPGPSGYDAVFTLRTADVPELADNKFAEPIAVLISGSALLYELDGPSPANGAAGADTRGRVSRHPPPAARASSALHLRALRCALRGVDRLLQRERVARPDAHLQDRRSGTAAPAAIAACCRRDAAAAALRAGAANRTAAAEIADLHLSHPRPPLVGYRLPRPGRPRRLHRLCPDAVSPGGGAGLHQLANVPEPQPAAAARADDVAELLLPLARQFLRTARASRSANAPPVSVIRARMFGRRRASRRPVPTAAPITTIWSRCATARSCARQGKRPPTSWSTPKPSISASATCT